MKVAGFTFVRNSVKYDYPIVESILSVIEIVDDFYVLIGNSDDSTLQQIKNIKHPKIHIYESVWNESLRKNGGVLADETNKCFDLIPKKYDWLFYLQADEIVHEQYLEVIKQSMLRFKKDEKVEGLLFRYEHFFGSYEFVGDSRKWYKKEIRIIRQNSNIRSYKDAQGFRIKNKKLHVKEIDAYIFHYGYIRNPKSMFEKTLEMGKFYRTNVEYEQMKNDFIKKYQHNFDYSEIDSLQKFSGTHPKVLETRIKNISWSIGLDTNKKKFSSFKNWLLYNIEKLTGYRLFEYKNYKKI